MRDLWVFTVYLWTCHHAALWSIRSVLKALRQVVMKLKTVFATSCQIRSWETVATGACTSSLGQVGSRSVHDRLPTPYASAREFQEVSLGFVEVELRSLQVFMSETEGELRICDPKSKVFRLLDNMLEPVNVGGSSEV